MARRLSLIAVLTLVVCLLPGCATITSQVQGDSGPRVFSGIRLHLQAMAGPTGPSVGPQSYWLPTLVPPLIVIWPPLDFPLSLAADIAILPYTIPAQLICGNFKKKEKPATGSTEK